MSEKHIQKYIHCFACGELMPGKIEDLRNHLELCEKNDHKNEFSFGRILASFLVNGVAAFNELRELKEEEHELEKQQKK